VEQAQYGREVGLLRVLVAGVEILPPVPHHQFTQEFLQAERIAIAQPDNGRLIVIRKPSAEAFLEFLDSLVSRSPAMERGTIFANVRKELMKTLADYVGRDAASIGPGALLGLVHVRIAGFRLILGRTRRVDDRCVHNRAAGKPQAFGFQVFVNTFKEVRPKEPPDPSPPKTPRASSSEVDPGNWTTG
jgi:hypothetical protein